VEDAAGLVGEIRDVTIVEAQSNSLKGMLVDARQKRAVSGL
jgi:hypothetical protein